MAAGDITWFQEWSPAIDGGWATTDSIVIALLTDASSPTAADVTPSPDDHTLATTTEGEQALGTLATFTTQSGAVTTFDSTSADVTWAQGGGNSANCRWGIIFNTTQAGNPGLGFVDLGQNRDLTQGSIKITWSTSPDAIAQITIA